MKVRKNFFATDENGNQVFIVRDDIISEFQDAGPVVNAAGDAVGWEVSCKFAPSHKQWTEIVIADAILVLKSLED